MILSSKMKMFTVLGMIIICVDQSSGSPMLRHPYHNLSNEKNYQPPQSTVKVEKVPAAADVINHDNTGTSMVTTMENQTMQKREYPNLCYLLLRYFSTNDNKEMPFRPQVQFQLL